MVMRGVSGGGGGILDGVSIGQDDFTGAFKGLTNPITPRKEKFDVNAKARNQAAGEREREREKERERERERAGQERLKHQLQPPSRPSVSSSRANSDEVCYSLEEVVVAVQSLCLIRKRRIRRLFDERRR